MRRQRQVRVFDLMAPGQVEARLDRADGRRAGPDARAAGVDGENFEGQVSAGSRGAPRSAQARRITPSAAAFFCG
jgi:hypothetical protein